MLYRSVISDYSRIMKSEKEYVMLKVAITEKEKNAAKAKAKTKGMTFQGYLGDLIQKDLSAPPPVTPSVIPDNSNTETQDVHLGIVE